MIDFQIFSIDFDYCRDDDKIFFHGYKNQELL